jgi:hypothetical protein
VSPHWNKEKVPRFLFFFIIFHKFLHFLTTNELSFAGRELRRSLPSLGGRRRPRLLLMLLNHPALQGPEEHWQGKLLPRQRERLKKQK